MRLFVLSYLLNVMICTSIGNIGFDELMEQLKVSPMAEIRLDLLNLSNEQQAEVFGLHRNLIATYRGNNANGVDVAGCYTAAIDAGCAYVDVDIDEVFAPQVVGYAKSHGCKVILSYHDFTETPNSLFLEQIINKMMAMGADVMKLACMANSPDDSDRVLNLYDTYQASNLVAFCMGRLGRKTRFIAPILGAPYTYASVDEGCETAPGQVSVAEMRRVLCC